MLQPPEEGMEGPVEQMFSASHCLHPTHGLYDIQILLGTHPEAFIPPFLL